MGGEAGTDVVGVEDCELGGALESVGPHGEDVAESTDEDAEVAVE